MTEVETYIASLPVSQMEIMSYLDQLLMDNPEMVVKMRYKIPFYYGKSWICYLNPIKRHGVELAFTRGNELSNQQGILISKGRKQVWGIEIFSIPEIPLNTLQEVIREALILDSLVPYGSKRIPRHRK